MRFLAPDFLLTALAIVLPIALHLLRRRVKRVVAFPTLRFLTQSKPADRRRQNLRRRVVLTLRCLALAALAAAFARPFFGRPEAPVQDAAVIVVDNSYSLRAGDRWPMLAERARDFAGRLGDRDTLGILLMNPTPSWLIAPTRDIGAARRALEELKPGWLATRAEPALRLAGDVLANTPANRRRIFFFGDHQAAGWAGGDFVHPLPPGVEIEFPEPAETAPEGQAAISALRLRREGEGFIATLTARNFGEQQLRVVRVYPDGDTGSPVLATLELPARGEATVDISLPGRAGFVRAELDPDALPADDTAWAVAPADPRLANVVLLDETTAPADHAGTAFTSLALMPEPVRLAPINAPQWPAGAVVVIRSPLAAGSPLAARVDAHLAAGGGALVFVGDEVTAGWLATHDMKVDPLTSAPGRVRDWTIEHPMVAPLAASGLRGLIGWTFARGWSLPADSVDPVASWSGGTVALGEVRVGAGHLLLAGFSPDRADGDWPVSPAFVPFLHQAALHLLDSRQANALHLVGQSPDAPAAGGVFTLIDGPADRAANATPANTPGLYEWTLGDDTRRYAINIDATEGDLSPWPDGRPWERLASAEPAPKIGAGQRALAADTEAESHAALWWWCFAALALLLLAELPLANRTAR